MLGAGKLVSSENRTAEIETAYRTNPAELAAYNLHDARLVLDILERTGLVELTIRRSLLTGMQLDRVGAQIAAVESLYLRALRARAGVSRRRSVRAPPRRRCPLSVASSSSPRRVSTARSSTR